MFYKLPSPAVMHLKDPRSLFRDGVPAVSSLLAFSAQLLPLLLLLFLPHFVFRETYFEVGSPISAVEIVHYFMSGIRNWYLEPALTRKHAIAMNVHVHETAPVFTLHS